MRLPDFNAFEPFRELRARMGAKRLGQFELFDPARHLTGEERSRLETEGIRLALGRVRVLPDRTLAFKNGRVLLFAPQALAATLEEAAQHYHVAYCDRLQQWRQVMDEQAWEVVLSTRRQPPFSDPDGTTYTLSICPRCLQTLGYKGYDERRNRKIAYSRQVLQQFSLDEYFALYTQYPVRGGELNSAT